MGVGVGVEVERDRCFLKWKHLNSGIFLKNSLDLAVIITLHVLPRSEG